MPTPQEIAINFAAWFKRSAIVDEQGRPRVVYHGTKREFDAFEPKYPDGLVFFTTNPAFASKWPEGFGGKGDLREPPPGSDEEYKRIRALENQLYSQFMRPADDYDFKGDGECPDYDRDRRALRDAIKQATGFLGSSDFESKAGIRVMPVLLSIQKPFNPPEHYHLIEDFLKSTNKAELVERGYHQSGNWLVYEDKAVIDHLKSLGFDGIWLCENIGGPHETIAPFETWQIKSAIGNSGLYDPWSNSLTDRVVGESDGETEPEDASVGEIERERCR